MSHDHLPDRNERVMVCGTRAVEINPLGVYVVVCATCGARKDSGCSAYSTMDSAFARCIDESARSCDACGAKE